MSLAKPLSFLCLLLLTFATACPKRGTAPSDYESDEESGEDPDDETDDDDDDDVEPPDDVPMPD